MNKKATVPITNAIDVKWSKFDLNGECNIGIKTVKNMNQKAGTAKTGIFFLLNNRLILKGVSQYTQISIATTIDGMIIATTNIIGEIPNSIQSGILGGIIS